jgi:hypothetical protein
MTSSHSASVSSGTFLPNHWNHFPLPIALFRDLSPSWSKAHASQVWKCALCKRFAVSICTKWQLASRKLQCKLPPYSSGPGFPTTIVPRNANLQMLKTVVTRSYDFVVSRATIALDGVERFGQRCLSGPHNRGQLGRYYPGYGHEQHRWSSGRNVSSLARSAPDWHTLHGWRTWN